MTDEHADQPPPEAPATAAAATVWWSVPQACVWIRTRNLAAVDGLDPRQALLLPLADHAKPGAVAASRCLRSALERGRFVAYGRRVGDIDQQAIPQAFWQAGGDFSIDLDGSGAAAPGDPERWVCAAVDHADCVRHWPSPCSVLANGPVPIQHLIEFGALHEGPEDNWAWFLGRDDVVVKGLDAQGHHVWIDMAALRESPAKIDPNGDLTLGELRWSCVIVGPPPRRPVSKAPPPVPTVGGARGGITWGPRLITKPHQLPQETPPPAVAGQTLQKQGIGNTPLNDDAVATDAPSDGNAKQDQQQLAAEMGRHGATQPSITPQGATRKPYKSELAEWYAKRVVNHDPQQLSPSRDDDVAAAEEYFKTTGITKLVYDARRQGAPPEWKRSGSKGKKKALAQSGQK